MALIAYPPMSHPLGLAPSKIIAVHLNFRSRMAELGRTPPAFPSYFLKPPSSLSWHGAPVVRPRGCELLNYEGEVAVVMGRRALRVGIGEALDHVAAYAAANDLGVYDLRYADRGSNLRSKGQDGFTPVGPALLDARAHDPARLRLRTWVNGELVQDASSGELLFPIAHLIADLSRLLTLEPGDIVLSGTPAGSRPLEPGDVVEVELDGAGRLRSHVVDADHDLEPLGAMPKLSPQERAAALGGTGRDAAVPAQILAMLGRVSTATLSSQLRRHGIEHAFIEGVRPTRPDRSMVGLARTLRYLPLREDVLAERGGGMNAQKRAVEELAPGEVLVIEARGEHGAGTIGDILALRALRRGAAGIVTDGGLRDSPAFAELDLPVYYAVPHAAVLARRHVPLDAGVPVACGNVLVMPGDVVVGDAAGVVVVPARLAAEIARDAVEQEHEERFIYQAVDAGAGIEGLFPLGPERRAEYEAWRRREEGGP
jgi:5-oxopent-3-ene-1,2,5-tricarboxylate decarboxylase / 2-hydroxyhepta-2,4-diene-1,7-dioate isomerase